MPVFGNVDAYQNRGIRSMLNFGHGQSPLCVVRKATIETRDPVMDACGAIREAAQVAKTFNRVSLPTY
jgi:hypothetical protein